MDIKAAKERYGFASWPQRAMGADSGKAASARKMATDGNIFPGYSLRSRESAGVPLSYRDIYIKTDDPQKRLEVIVKHAENFEGAKKRLIENLALCSVYLVPRSDPNDIGDLSFGLAGEKTSCAFVRDHSFVSIRSIGESDVDVSPFAARVDEALKMV